MKTAIATAILGLSTLAILGGCQSKQEKDVTTTGRSQYAYTEASVAAATDAAKSVLEEREMKNITATSTAVDGKVYGEKANGTGVRIWLIRQKDENNTKIEVTVGVVGGPSLGAEIAQAIKEKADGMPTNGNRMGAMHDTMGRDPATMPMR